MKRIRLINQHNRYGDLEPRTYDVEWETDTQLSVKSRVMGTMLLTKQADGTFVNEHRVVYVKVKADTRPKPFKVEYASGIGEGSKVTKFATLSEVQEYVKGRWQGTDYIDGPAVFHGDYGHFYLSGCTLADLGSRGEFGTDAWWDWTWKELKPLSESPAIAADNECGA